MRIPMNEQAARDYLGGWGFIGDTVNRPAQFFSGGEKARMVLAMLARSEPALLLLDEPTNHLDIEMRQALALALQEYRGALLIVSHDRNLLRQCVDEFWIVADGEVQPYTETLDEYAEFRQANGNRRSAGHARQAERRQKAVRREALKAVDLRRPNGSRKTSNAFRTSLRRSAGRWPTARPTQKWIPTS